MQTYHIYSDAYSRNKEIANHALRNCQHQDTCINLFIMEHHTHTRMLFTPGVPGEISITCENCPQARERERERERERTSFISPPLPLAIAPAMPATDMQRGTKKSESEVDCDCDCA